MKLNFKKLIIIPLLLAVTLGPVRADNQANATIAPIATNVTQEQTATAPVVTQPTLAAPAEPATPKSQKQNDEDDHPPVRIDMTGIHVGGKNPVDITAPGMGGMIGTKSSLGKNFIAFTAIVTPFAFFIVIALVFFVYRHRRQRMLHETLRTMIDKGVAIPPELVVPKQYVRRRAASDLRSGLVCVGIGIGMMIAVDKIGVIVLLIGVGFLVAWFIERKNNPTDSPEK